MDITMGTVGLAVGPAVVTLLGMLLVLKKDIKEQREREKRQRQIEVESEPLINLRNQLAGMSSFIFIHDIMVQLKELQRQVEEKVVRRGGTPRGNEELENLVKSTYGVEGFLAEVRNFYRALHQVDSEEIIHEAETGLHVLLNDWSNHGGGLKTRLQETKGAILHIQSLINKRLGEIGYYNELQKK